MAPRLEDAMRAAALDATVELAASVLRCELGARIEDEANNTGLFVAAQMFIKRHLTSHHINPELIARQLRCSRAHLYRVFAAQGESVANYVRELRLQRAHHLLTHGDVSREHIGDIAYRCGFEDPVHFTRSFRQRFGLTPSELRSSLASPNAATDATGSPSALSKRGALQSWVDAVIAAILFSEILL
jgi:AraC family transcriptional regulator, positive regulator of tynA and feaB